GECGTRQRVGQPVVHVVGDGDAGRGAVFGDLFEVARPLEAEIVSEGRLDHRVPIDHEDSLTGYGGGIGARRCASVCGRGGGGGAIGGRRFESEGVEGSGHMVSGAELVVQLGKGNVLLGGTWKGSQLGGDEGVGGSAG